MWGRLLAQVLGAKRSDLPRQIEIPRGNEKPKPPVLTPEQITAWFSKHITPN